MATRGQESPMDFQWDNTHGRIDPNSPFKSVLQTHTSCRPASSIYSALPPKTPLFTTPTPQPQRTPSFTPSGAQRFATPGTRLPQPSPYRTPSFTTPRTAAAVDTPSKDSDMQSPPGDPMQDSPDFGSLAGLSLRKPNSSRALLPSASSSTAPLRITGRGEIPRGRHEGAVSKPRRRRANSVARITRRSSYEDEDEDDDGGGRGDREDDDAYDSSSSQGGTPQQQPSWRRRRRARSRSRTHSRHSHQSPGWGEKWVEAHRELPIIASRYAQFLFNTSLTLLFLYMIYCFFLTVRADVTQKVEEQSAAVLAEIANCQREYVANRCAPDLRVPALEARCAAWDACMNRDPLKIGRAKASAETFAEILNTFIEQLSYKTMLFCFLMVVGVFMVSNMAFGHFRAKKLEQIHPYMAAAISPMAPPPPPPRPVTPYRTPQHSYQSQYSYGGGGGGGGLNNDDHGLNRLADSPTPMRTASPSKRVLAWR